MFNAATTWIEDIVGPRGFSIVQAGNAGGLMIVGGMIGAIVIPILSDHYRSRTPFLLAAVIGATMGLVGFQYGAKVTHPTPEGTTNGLLLLMGQISGIIFILGMDGLKSPDTGSMTLPLVVLIALMVLSLLLCTGLREARARESILVLIQKMR